MVMFRSLRVTNHHLLLGELVVVIIIDRIRNINGLDIINTCHEYVFLYNLQK